MVMTKQCKSTLRNKTVNKQRMIECNPIMAYSLVRFVLIFFNDIRTRDFSFILGTKAIRQTLTTEYRGKYCHEKIFHPSVCVGGSVFGQFSSRIPLSFPFAYLDKRYRYAVLISRSHLKCTWTYRLTMIPLDSSQLDYSAKMRPKPLKIFVTFAFME